MGETNDDDVWRLTKIVRLNDFIRGAYTGVVSVEWSLFGNIPYLRIAFCNATILLLLFSSTYRFDAGIVAAL